MSSKNHQLSKSSLIRSIQCLKSLYLYKNHYDLRNKPNKVQQQKFDRGHRIGKLAQQLLPNGKDCTPPSPMQYNQSIAATKLLIEQRFPVIYEAAFKFHGILVALDMLEFRKDDGFYAYEVKSSMSVSQTYLLDCAIQYYVIEQSGVQLKDFFIVYVNGNYVRKSDIDVRGLFKIKSILSEIKALQPYVQEKIKAAIDVLELPKMPDISIGVHCNKPYPCDFINYCWKDVPSNSIWYLQGVSLNDKIEAVAQSITTIEAYAEKHQEDVKLKCLLDNKILKNEKKLSAFFNKIQYPMCFFDLEAFQSAIPIFEGTKPYERIPFLYSLHIQETESAEYVHKDFYCPPTKDFRKAFIEHFLEATQGIKTIVVYNDLMEKGTLNYLAHLFPEYKIEIQQRIDALLDMEIPFKHLDYYHPKQLGSFSLKTISSAMLEDNPYSKIDIKDGEEAMAIYNELFYKSSEEQQKYEVKLRAYCKTDTYVLIQIKDKLLNNS